MLGALSRCLLIAFLVLVPALAWAEPQVKEKEEPEKAEGIDTEHIFGFSEGSSIGKKGEHELESITIASFGKVGSYASIDNETSIRYTVTDQLRLSIGTLADYYAINNVPALSNRTAATFSGVIGEARLNIVNNETNPFGLSLSFNPAFRQFDPLTGVGTRNYALPVTLLFDKAVIPEKLFFGVNLIYTPSFFPVPGGGREHDDEFSAIAALTYAVLPKVFLGVEARHENLIQNGVFDSHALFVGPSLFYQITPEANIKVAYAAQIPDVSAHTLDLDAYQRHQIELQFAYGF